MATWWEQNKEEIKEHIDRADSIVFEYSGGKDSGLAMMKTKQIAGKKPMTALYATPGVEIPSIPLHVMDVCGKLKIPLVTLTPYEDFMQYFDRKRKWPSPVYRECMFKFILEPIDRTKFGMSPGVLRVRGSRGVQQIHKGEGGMRLYSEIPQNKSVLRVLNPIFAMPKEEFQQELAEFPMIKWPGYDHGFVRTACWLCPFQTAQQYETLEVRYPGLFRLLKVLHDRWTPHKWGVFNRFMCVKKGRPDPGPRKDPNRARKIRKQAIES